MYRLTFIIFVFLFLSFTARSKIAASEPYPPPQSIHALYSPQTTYKLHLPIVLSAEQPDHDRYYVQADKLGDFYGVWATIETPDPAIREPYFSYISINIISPGGQWIEVGVNKGVFTGCIPKFSWAIQPGDTHIILDPLPQIGVPYQYMIERVADGNWLIRIMTTNGLVIYQTSVNNPGMNFGDRLQSVGEVNSPNKLNDMGVSGILTLKMKTLSSVWSYWDGWTLGIYDNPPYVILGIPPDPANNVQIYGNNGNPIPPGAPCP